MDIAEVPSGMTGFAEYCGKVDVSTPPLDDDFAGATGPILIWLQCYLHDQEKHRHYSTVVIKLGDRSVGLGKDARVMCGAVHEMAMAQL